MEKEIKEEDLRCYMSDVQINKFKSSVLCINEDCTSEVDRHGNLYCSDHEKKSLLNKYKKCPTDECYSLTRNGHWCDACHAKNGGDDKPVEASEEVLRAYPKTNIIDLVSCFEHVLKLNYLEEGTFDLCDIEFKRTEGEIDFKIKFTGN